MKAGVVWIFTGMFLTQFCFSQEYIDQRETFFDAQYFFSFEDYEEAVFHYIKLHNFQKYNASLNYKIGVCYLNITGSKTKAIPYLENAIRNTTRRYRPKNFRAGKAPQEAFLLLGRAYRINNELDKAESILREYEALLSNMDDMRRQLVKREFEIAATARELQKNPVNVRITNMEGNFNTRNNDFNPAVSGDGNSMVYMTSLRFYDAIMYATKKNGEWTTPVNIVEQLGSDGNHYASSLSWNGTELYVVIGDKYRSDIHVSYLQNGIWGKLTPLGRNINTQGRESHASVSKDGLTMYFTSNRPGGYGGLDIYRTTRKPGGDWKPAINQGPIINSAYDEMAPFLTGNGKKLYFTSFGHFNMGEFDIYFSEVGADGNYTTPVNIGWPLNTTDDEMFFAPLNNGAEGYLAMFDEHGFGGSDLYFVEFNPLPVEKPIQVLSLAEFTVIRGRYHSRLLDTLETGMVVLSVMDDSARPQTYHVPHELLQQEAGLLPDASQPVDRCVTINSVFFTFNNSTISRYAAYELEKAINLMKFYPAIELEITGHTCAVGSLEVNQTLSEKRARAVHDYMVQRGIEPGRLSVRGKGKTEPVAINTNPDGSDNPIGRSYNQRAEIRVTTPGYEFILSEDVFVPVHLRVKK